MQFKIQDLEKLIKNKSILDYDYYYLNKDGKPLNRNNNLKNKNHQSLIIYFNDGNILELQTAYISKTKTTYFEIGPTSLSNLVESKSILDYDLEYINFKSKSYNIKNQFLIIYFNDGSILELQTFCTSPLSNNTTLLFGTLEI